MVDGSISEQTQEKIYFFLTDWIEPRSAKKKSVLAHSIRVGMSLVAHHAPRDAVLAGFLHDVLETTEADYDILAHEFGQKVADLVLANTIDKSQNTGLPGYHDSVNRCARLGADALVVRAADLLDNFQRHYHRDPLRFRERFQRKFYILDEYAGRLLADHSLYRDLEQKIRVRASLVRAGLDPRAATK